MRTFNSWRQSVGLLSEDVESEVDWNELRRVYGEIRQVAKPELLQDLKSNILSNTSLEKYLEMYGGNKDEFAKDFITASLKVIFGEEAGSGLGVSASELGKRQSPSPLGTASPESPLTQPPTPSPTQ